MLLGPLSSVSNALRASTSRLLPALRLNALSSSSRSSSYALLESLSPAPGSVHKKQRVGRGNSSKRGGHTSGRGHKGAKARGTGVPYRGFEGGQTPFFRRFPQRGFKNFLSKDFQPLNIHTIQRWIAQGRFDPSETLTIGKAVHTRMVHGLSKQDGIKLCGRPISSLPLPPLNIELSRFSQGAAKAIIKAGGSCLAVYYNKLSLRQEIMPRKFEGKEIQNAGPTRRKDIEFYTNPKNYGYLAGKADEFFRSKGFDPEGYRATWAKGDASQTPAASGESTAAAATAKGSEGKTATLA